MPASSVSPATSALASASLALKAAIKAAMSGWLCAFLVSMPDPSSRIDESRASLEVRRRAERSAGPLAVGA